MNSKLRQHLNNLSIQKDGQILATPLKAIVDRLSCCALATAGLVIKVGGSTLAKTGATAFYATVKGKLVTIAAATDMPALTGLTITAAKFNVACFYIDDASTVTMKAGTEGASIAAVKFPQPPEGKTLVGALLITHSSTFTGGTTALDTATTVYLSPIGAFDATILL